MKRSLHVLTISLEYPPCSIGGYEVMCAQVCASHVLPGELPFV